MDIETNVNFLLSHFDESSLFPRKMMTKHKNYQFTVYNKKELIQKCLESDLIDCRINGYPILDKQEISKLSTKFYLYRSGSFKLYEVQESPKDA